MNPKKAVNLYKTISEELEVDHNLVEDLIEYVYKTLKKNLTNLSHPRINVDGLGQFVAKPYAIKKGIETIETKLITHDTSTFAAYQHKKVLEIKVEAMKNLHEMIVKEEERKINFKKSKDEAKLKGDLEE
jgi:nucleoid DNA-binding protein